jgi:transcriptional regulator with XRE-family HTH domain
MKFKALQENLRKRLWKEMKNDGLTGMALARDTGVGQAHISNFMNGKRGLSLEAMDRVLAARHLSVLDLLDPAEINIQASIPNSSDTEFQNIPLVDGCADAFTPRITRGMTREILKFPTGFLRSLRPACERARAQWERFLAMQVEPREGMSMFPRLLPGATILVDRHYNSLKPYRRGECNMFVVHKPNGNCTICYIETGGDSVILRPHNHVYPVEMLILPDRHPVSRYIVGRIAHVGIET